MEDKDFLALVKKVLEEQTKVPVDREIKKWENNGYEVESRKPGIVHMTKQKGKITHSATISHDGKHVTDIKAKQSGPISALSPEEKADWEEAKGQAAGHKETLKRRARKRKEWN